MIRFNRKQQSLPEPDDSFGGSSQAAAAAAGPFISWVSVALLVLLILFLRSSVAPFLNPKGEPRRSASTYTNMSIILYGWVVSATALTVIPHFSTHYNIIIAFSLFFPMGFATVGSVVVGRFLVRIMYYATARFLRRRQQQQQQHLLNTGKVGTIIDKTLSDTSSVTSGDSRQQQPKPMVAFHRPFRKLMRTSVFLSLAVCSLYAHCWSRDLGAFKMEEADGAGAICRAVFSPYAFGFYKTNNGADESCIWIIWASGVICMVVSFLVDEFGGKHYYRDMTMPLKRAISSGSLSQSLPSSDHRSDDNIMEDDMSDSSSIGEGEGVASSKEDSEREDGVERPEGTLPMVSWYSLLLFNGVFDLLVELKVFLGRFDARTLMKPVIKDWTVGANGELNGKASHSPCFDASRYPKGSVFDCRPINSNNGRVDDEEVWFDFMADCGDGFDSSYQVARMLAQPQLPVKSRKSNAGGRVLPRGSFLVVGGDLAYPHPTEESFEKRFFRTFEDAMPPPPSFRRAQISVNKPALPVKGWKDCFVDKTPSKDKESKDDDSEDLLRRYKGPCAFLIPGNHDWYDGLATYSRYILSRDWLGGWLMPQKHSYFALKLPHGWWLLAFDLGLSEDIDLHQFKFFADISANAMGPSDSCITVTHQPAWVLDADRRRSPDELSEKHLRELMKHHLGGRVRARLAGDLHHYTRHIPSVSRTTSRVRSRSSASHVQPSISSPAPALPELIVSGGGGAFMHPTHTYSNRIRVGENQDSYVRMRAYPDERTSYRLAWLNIWQFRWRNWRFDMVGAATYFGIASSMFPLCGIYADYLAFNPSHNPLYLMLWLAKTVLALFLEIFASGRISIIVTVSLTAILYMVTDLKLKPPTRLLWGVSHGLVHVGTALLCLLFVQCIAEWSIHEGIVKVAATATKTKPKEEGINLAASLYEEYKQHFSGFLESNIIPSPQVEICDTDGFNWFEQLHAHAYEIMENTASWVYKTVPLLKTTLAVFDLPHTIAQKHTDICEILCSGDIDCMMSSTIRDIRYQRVGRATLFPYLAAQALYFFVVAIPFAGNVFGTWLAFTLNFFNAQPDEGFSSLRIRHWKNFLRLHLTKDGDLEIFAIGLHRVPKKWKKDTLWDGNSDDYVPRRQRLGLGYGKQVAPSWSWDRPSKWIPDKLTKRFDPELIDYTRISKTRPEQWNWGNPNGTMFASEPALERAISE